MHCLQSHAVHTEVPVLLMLFDKMPENQNREKIFNDIIAIGEKITKVRKKIKLCDNIEKQSLEKLEQIKELDKRIKVFHKQNEGLATTRDYGASKSNEHARYLMFIDDDDLIEPTYLECAYWTLETNKDAAWAYSDSLGFGSIEYTWNKYFSSEKMKKENDLISAALVRKTDFFLVNGYNLKEKAVNEDWNFWLKLLSKEKFPVHISFYGEWYRRKENGELQRSRENKERSLEIINNTAKGVTKVDDIEYILRGYENFDKKLRNISKIN